MGIDANCKIGTDISSANPNVGSFGSPELNDRCRLFKQFLATQEYCVINTFFRKKHYETKYCTLHKKWYTPDFILTPCAHKMRFTDCEVESTAPSSTHFPVMAKIRAALWVKKRKKKKSKCPECSMARSPWPSQSSSVHRRSDRPLRCDPRLCWNGWQHQLRC